MRENFYEDLLAHAGIGMFVMSPRCNQCEKRFGVRLTPSNLLVTAASNQATGSHKVSLRYGHNRK